MDEEAHARDHQRDTIETDRAGSNLHVEISGEEPAVEHYLVHAELCGHLQQPSQCNAAQHEGDAHSPASNRAQNRLRANPPPSQPQHHKAQQRQQGD